MIKITRGYFKKKNQKLNELKKYNKKVIFLNSREDIEKLQVIKMLFDEKYDYLLIDSTVYDMRYLNAKDDGSLIRKYKKVFYKDKNNIKSNDLDENQEIPKDYILIYDIEEINTTDTCWDSEYEECYFYRVKGIGDFMKIRNFSEDNDNKKIKMLIDKYDNDMM